MKGEKLTYLDIFPLHFSDFSFDIEVLEDIDFRGSHLSPLFLGKFSLQELKFLLIKNRVIEKLIGMGYDKLHYRVEIDNNIDNKLYISGYFSQFI